MDSPASSRPRQFGVQAWTLALFVVSCLPSAEAQAPSCLRTPISVPIKNVTIAGGAPGAIARGMAISVGTPPQEIAFMPLWFNNSFVYDNTNFCPLLSGASADPQDCITWRGGAYNPFVSTTQKQGVSAAVAADPASPSTKIYSDTLTLNKNTQIANYTIGVPLDYWGEQYYRSESMLGLGTNSTFLTSLKSQGLIASRSYSFYWGRTGRDQRTDGSVVFGGYDKNKIQNGATGFTQKLNYTDCEFGTSVELSMLGLIAQNGKTTNLFNSTSTASTAARQIPLFACIDPGYVGMAIIPYYNYFSNFVRATEYDSFINNTLGGATIRSTGYNFWDLLYLPGDEPFLGDLNVTIKGGPSIRLQNKELVVPHVYMDTKTHTWQENTTLSDLRINANPDSTAGRRMTLGRNAMTFLYLMINHDSGTFTVWPAFGDATTEDLQAVDEKNNPVQSTSTCAADPATTPPTNSSPTKTADPVVDDKKLSVGAIVGIAIGAVLGIAAFVLGVLFFIRRGRKKEALEASGTPVWLPPTEIKDQNQNQDQTIHEVGGNYEAKHYAGANAANTSNVPLAAVGQAPPQAQAYHEMPTSPQR